MGILGMIESKQKRFSVGGREVLCIDADLPTGASHAATHILNLVENLCAYAEREQLKGATDALMDAVQAGQGYRFAKRLYRIALSEAPVGKRHRVTLTASLSYFDVQFGERIDQFHRLETLWDAGGALQMDEKRRKWRRSVKNREGNDDGQRSIP